MFKIHAFRHPAARFCPAYFWGIGGPMNVDDMCKQLRDMVKVGARSVCLEPLPREFNGTFRMSPASAIRLSCRRMLSPRAEPVSVCLRRRGRCQFRG